MDIARLACDWGSTSLRVYALDERGNPIAVRTSKDGLLEARKIGFDNALFSCAKGWTERKRQILLCGMVGARGGWVEVPYCPAPASIEDIAKKVAKVTTRFGQIYIVPGISYQGEQFEVMRGEETQIMGAQLIGSGDGIYVLPGTHSKWVQVRRGKIVTWKTYITGDVFAALRNHSVLQLLILDEKDWDWDGEGFAQGVAIGAKFKSGTELLNRLFSVRTNGLAESMPAEQLGPYLSGLLLGCELGDKQGLHANLIGATEIVYRYQQAGQVLDIKFNVLEPNLAVLGLVAIADYL